MANYKWLLIVDKYVDNLVLDFVSP